MGLLRKLPLAGLFAVLVPFDRAPAQSFAETRALLFGIEAESHQQWLRSDLAALDGLMSDDFRFVAMSGGVETKQEVLGIGAARAAPRPLQVEQLHVEPEELVLHGNTAVVISLLHLDATIQGRRVPPRMRILSVFMRESGGAEWKLAARSITPILTPPPREEYRP